MTPKSKVALLILGLVLPFMAMWTYFVVVLARHPGIILPSWYAYVVTLYILVSIVLVMVVRHRIAARTPQEQTKRIRAWARLLLMYLLALSFGAFFYGAFETLKGDLTVARAISGGAYLLTFIVLFSWTLYKYFKRKSR